MGPFVLAAITHDARKVVLDTDHVDDALSLADTTGLVSILSLPEDAVYSEVGMCGMEDDKGVCKAEDVLSYTLDGAGQYLKVEKDAILAASNIATTGEGFDASFRVVKAYRR